MVVRTDLLNNAESCPMMTSSTLKSVFIRRQIVRVRNHRCQSLISIEDDSYESDENGCDRRRRTNKKAKAWRVNMRVTVKVTLPAWILTLANEKQQLPKKEDANSGGQNQKRDVDNVESTNLKNNYKGASSGKKASRASYDSDTEYGNKKQVCSKVEVYSGGMTQKREEEAGSKHNKERYISDSRGKKIARNSVDS
ncbi:hypothetical protein Bca52824_074917 [Brassica carinata]|uniref:Uncharacterized protein n=1 Tax=Brassica carinata TaxID=52824 RepID=A0A8X7PRE6_BRACI|nr:hypothetical protein Bca52824_074917 [Brassica carinata]